MRAQLAILVTLVSLHVGIAHPIENLNTVDQDVVGSLQTFRIQPRQTPLACWSQRRVDLTDCPNHKTVSGCRICRLGARCDDVPLGTQTASFKCDARIVKRFIQKIHDVPAWVAHMLATHGYMRTLDEAPSTRIMGLGFLVKGGQCHVPALSFEPAYVGPDAWIRGEFWYIEDVPKGESGHAIWEVLARMLWNVHRQTLESIRAANGQGHPCPEPWAPYNPRPVPYNPTAVPVDFLLNPRRLH